MTMMQLSKHAMSAKLRGCRACPLGIHVHVHFPDISAHIIVCHYNTLDSESQALQGQFFRDAQCHGAVH